MSRFRSTFLTMVAVAVAAALPAAGYQTWHMGKAGETNAFGTGLKHFEIHIPDDAHGESPDNDRAHSSQRLADKTIEFLESRDAGGEQRPLDAPGKQGHASARCLPFIAPAFTTT